MFIAMNRFTINPEQAGAFEARWRERNSRLGEVPGFIRFRLLRLDDAHFSSYVEWENYEAFDAWTESDAFREAHSKGMPAGILAGPPRFEGWDVVMEQP